MPPSWNNKLRKLTNVGTETSEIHYSRHWKLANATAYCFAQVRDERISRLKYKIPEIASWLMQLHIIGLYQVEQRVQARQIISLLIMDIQLFLETLL